jgi:uncharacterized protein
MGMRPFTSVSFADVELTGKFWSERLDMVLAKTIPSQYEKLAEYNILDPL